MRPDDLINGSLPNDLLAGDPPGARRGYWCPGCGQDPTTRPTDAAGGAAADPTATATGGGGGVLPGPRAGVVEIQVPLTTLLGLSQLPGELTRWGPVLADITRQTVTQMHDAQWRFSVYGDLGELAHHGIITTRPTGPTSCASEPTDPDLDFGPAVDQPTIPVPDLTGDVVGNSVPGPVPDLVAGPEFTGAGFDGRAHRRPTASQLAFVRSRDRTCVAPGCRRTARQCDVDHTHDWVKGGHTICCNLGLLCRRHHMFKHAAGCALWQVSPGVFVWSTPAGMQYLTTPDRPLIDDNELAGLPKPTPQPDPEPDALIPTGRGPDPGG